MENILTRELTEKARQTKSPEELAALAKENGIELSEEEAKAYFERLGKIGELSDDELDSVAGGGCYYGDGRLVVTAWYWCRRFVCAMCGTPGDSLSHQCPHKCKAFPAEPLRGAQCSECKYKTNKGVRMLCNHPDNYKR